MSKSEGSMSLVKRIAAANTWIQTIGITGALRRLGPLGRRIAWNREFRNGARFVGERSSRLQALIAEHAAERRVVELACGDGSLARVLANMNPTSYRGFDVSSTAIQEARARAAPGQEFRVQQMQDWKPTEPFDLLLVEEAIYYISQEQQADLIAKAFRAAPQCVIVIAVHSSVKHKASIDNCKQCGQVISDVIDGERHYIALRHRAA